MIKEKRDKKLGVMEAFKVVSKIKETAKTRPKKDYNSGLAGEHLIVSSLSTMNTHDLKQLRHLINKMIEEKVIAKRIQDKNKGVDTK